MLYSDHCCFKYDYTFAHFAILFLVDDFSCYIKVEIDPNIYYQFYNPILKRDICFFNTSTFDM